METPTMGKVLVTARIENLEDLYSVKKGLLPDDQVRRIEVARRSGRYRRDHAAASQADDRLAGT